MTIAPIFQDSWEEKAKFPLDSSSTLNITHLPVVLLWLYASSKKKASEL